MGIFGSKNKKNGDDQIVIHSEVACKLDVPSKPGYTFQGWVTKNGLALKEEVSAADGNGITIYSKWRANRYSVKFLPNVPEGVQEPVAMMPDLACVYDREAKLTANAYEVLGWSFAGWATSATGDIVYLNQANIKNLAALDGAEVTLYAVWKVNSYEVQFDAMGGKVAKPAITLVHGSKYGTLPVPTKDGYAFVAWETVEGIRITPETVFLTGANVKLHAKWAKLDAVALFEGTAQRDIELKRTTTHTETATVGFNREALIAGGYKYVNVRMEVDCKENDCNRVQYSRIRLLNYARVQLLDGDDAPKATAKIGISDISAEWKTHTINLTIAVKDLDESGNFKIKYSTADGGGSKLDGWWLGRTKVYATIS